MIAWLYSLLLEFLIYLMPWFPWVSAENAPHGRAGRKLRGQEVTLHENMVANCTGAMNTTVSLQFDMDLDFARLKAACCMAQQENPLLRTCISGTKIMVTPVEEVNPLTVTHVPQNSLIPLDVRATLSYELNRPFIHASKSCPFRMVVLGTRCCVVTIDHRIADGLALISVLHEVFCHYERMLRAQADSSVLLLTESPASTTVSSNDDNSQAAEESDLSLQNSADDTKLRGSVQGTCSKDTKEQYTVPKPGGMQNPTTDRYDIPSVDQSLPGGLKALFLVVFRFVELMASFMSLGGFPMRIRSLSRNWKESFGSQRQGWTSKIQLFSLTPEQTRRFLDKCKKERTSVGSALTVLLGATIAANNNTPQSKIWSQLIVDFRKFLPVSVHDFRGIFVAIVDCIFKANKCVIGNRNSRRQFWSQCRDLRSSVLWTIQSGGLFRSVLFMMIANKIAGWVSARPKAQFICPSFCLSNLGSLDLKESLFQISSFKTLASSLDNKNSVFSHLTEVFPATTVPIGVPYLMVTVVTVNGRMFGSISVPTGKVDPAVLDRIVADMHQITEDVCIED